MNINNCLKRRNQMTNFPVNAHEMTSLTLRNLGVLRTLVNSHVLSLAYFSFSFFSCYFAFMIYLTIIWNTIGLGWIKHVLMTSFSGFHHTHTYTHTHARSGYLTVAERWGKLSFFTIQMEWKFKLNLFIYIE